MEYIFELIFEILFESVFLTSTNKKISKLIRYPLIAIISIAFALVCFMFIFLGIRVSTENIIAGGLLIIFGLFFTILSIVKFKKIYLKKKKHDC